MCVMPCFIQLTSIINPFMSYLAETDTNRNHKTAMEIIFLYSRLQANKFEISFCIVRTLHGKLQMEVTGKQIFQSFNVVNSQTNVKNKTTRGLLLCVLHNFFFLQLHEFVPFFFSAHTHTHISHAQSSLYAHNTHSCLQSCK
jgi:hypothetical protein